ncbi:TIGR01777 family oxidoreductase [Marinicella sp. S1101]|uniref:TIGR01777 family oxidoreductase n=1 Tax=Marinicella marina TaxID=2996016 RepID=UPI0022609CFE|nr:TIGR01777 family oxidoreductase [Marinicella marina]MCX7553734.1 TIGR01777 family oxidoreductase [Marinicella marina]MDJ1140809.1 TIGR01777 family oxidoreductase [Marinicella marina]
MKTTKPIVFITGQSGMVGTALTEFLSNKYHVHGLERSKSSAKNPSWNYRQSLEKLGIDAPDIVIHLAGAGIADKRWNANYKQVIYDSRINGTQWLVDEVLIHEQKPKLFLSASAIGFYGHRPGEVLTESAEAGTNFVAKISKNWEKATTPLSQAGIRTVNMRFGMVLSQNGGALKEMLLPFKLGLGGRMGDGQQKYSWVAIEDVVHATHFLINNSNIDGVVNITSPHAVSNSEYTRYLAKALNRPAFFHMPKPVVRLAFGEVADELLLANAEVKPEKLVAAGYTFKQPQLKAFFEEIL